MTRSLRSFALGGACALAMGAIAQAQTTPVMAASGANANTVEEVTVTAQKRAENVQKVPLSVTPVTGEQMDRLHIQDLRDLTGMVPNVQINVSAGDAPAAAISIRGIGIANNPSPFVGTEIGTVIDGVVQGTNGFGLANQFDVNRIEILAGPQGTLFGANTTGGVVNIVHNQPTGVFGGYGEIGYGNYNAFKADGAINLPLIDGVLAGKVAFSHNSQDGFYTNLFNGQNLGASVDNMLTTYLKWTPNANLDVTLEDMFDRDHPGTNVLYPDSYPGELFYRAGTGIKYAVYSDVPDYGHLAHDSHTLTINWASPFGKITSISNYSNYTSNSAQDVANIDCLCFDAFSRGNGWQASEELRDVFHPFQGVEVLAGFYTLVWHDHSDFITITPFATPAGQPSTPVGRNITNETNKNVSGFTQIYWDVTDRLRIQAGMRVSWDNVELGETPLNYYLASGANAQLGFKNETLAVLVPDPPGDTNGPASGHHDWTNLGGKIGADYKLTDRVMLYGYYARGFKSGGFNGRVTEATDIGPYNPEFVDSFEIGLKSDWFDRRVRLNLAGFLNKWKDMQVTQSVYRGNPPVAASTILNAAAATTDGIEVTTEIVPVDGLHLDASLGYLHASYDNFQSGTGAPCPPLTQTQPEGCSAVYTGRTLPYSPEWTWNIAATYTHEVGPGDATGMIQYTYTASKWGNYTQSPSEALPAVGLLNANLSWGPHGAPWTVELWGRNLLNKLYVADALDVPPLFTEGVLGPPREFGVDFKYKF